MRRTFASAAAAALICAAPSAWAQTGQAPADAAQVPQSQTAPQEEDASSVSVGDISPAEWRALTAGKTVVYQRWGKPWGFESYAADSDAVYWRTPQGECMDGEVKVSQTSPPIYCFSWSNESVWCGRHMRGADGSLAALDVIDGGSALDMTSAPHMIVRILDKAQACTPEGMS